MLLERRRARRFVSSAGALNEQGRRLNLQARTVDGKLEATSQERLPVVPVPLRPEDQSVPLDLQEVLETAFDRAGYDQEIDYTQDPVPPLSREWETWARRLLCEKGLRPRETPR